MMSTINKLTIPILLILFCCKNTEKEKNFSNHTSENLKLNNHVYIDSLFGDFNFDKRIDIIRIEKINKNKLLFNLYENKSVKPTLSLKNVIYNIGDLKPTSDFLTLSFDEGTIIITQEYGSQNPEGWYIINIINKNNEYVVDSISNSRKKYINDEIDIVAKTKIINKPLKKKNLIKEFDKL